MLKVADRIDATLWAPFDTGYDFKNNSL